MAKGKKTNSKSKAKSKSKSKEKAKESSISTSSMSSTSASNSTGPRSPSFFDMVEARVQLINSFLCVGLDPHMEDIEGLMKDAYHSLLKGGRSNVFSAETMAKAGDKNEQRIEAARLFCDRVIRQTSHLAAAYKPNAAFFEALGHSGIELLQHIIETIPSGIPVILDVKRGDISSTAQAYATACFDVAKAHCVTVHPYMGSDSIFPFSNTLSRGVFVLCKTSNPSSNEFETLKVIEEEDEEEEGDATSTSSKSTTSAVTASTSQQQSHSRLYEVVAKKCETWNQETRNIGLVVGATDQEALRRARAAAPSVWILAPGIGFQGGNLESAVAAGLRDDGTGLLVPVSRAISRAEDPKAAASDFVKSLNDARKAFQDSQAKRKSSGSSSSSSNGSSSSSSSLAPDSKRARTDKARTDVSVAAPGPATGNNSNNGIMDANKEQVRDRFFKLCLDFGVLKFGSFVLKSGRKSPYFFNAGLFNSGSAVSVLAQCYAHIIAYSAVEFDVLFGPAYKGISLASSVVAELYSSHGIDKPFAYNRKEKKDHGEGGALVGSSVAGKRVLIIDDVITAGTAVRESMNLLHSEKANVTGIIVALDREEKVADDKNGLSAIQSVKKEFGIDAVLSIAGLADLLEFVKKNPSSTGGADVLSAIEAYRDQYGVKD